MLFLVSDEEWFITGTKLVIDGVKSLRSRVNFRSLARSASVIDRSL